jgi:hypothetical protein
MTEVHLPPVSDDQISRDLVWMTELLADAGAEISGGFLGGEFGYGAYFENETFMMHPFCWCERGDCPWCLGCECEVEDRGEQHEWPDRWVTTKTCANCSQPSAPAPNFLHKSSGTEVRWYKYIGRSMEVHVNGDWRTILLECAGSIEDAS